MTDLIERLRDLSFHMGTLLGDEAADEIERLRARIDSAPRAFMDTRVKLSLCAPTEADFPALYALQRKRVALLVLDETSNEATK